MRSVISDNNIIYMIMYWLVVEPTPETYESQIGSSSQTIGENQIHVPNHQSDVYI